MSTRRRAASGLVAVLLLLPWPIDGGWQLPARWNPWAPLDVSEPPSLLTGYKLARAAADGDRCLDALVSGGWAAEPVPATRTEPGCGLDGAVRTTPRDAEARALLPPVVLSCPAALSLSMWLRHVVAPATERHYGGRLARIEHLGTYACRDIEGRAGRRSEHASAGAIDISAFVLAGGRKVAVARGWQGGADGAFLREVHEGACRFFRGVLGPDYNRAHADHFHLDRGPYRICR